MNIRNSLAQRTIRQAMQCARAWPRFFSSLCLILVSVAACDSPSPKARPGAGNIVGTPTPPAVEPERTQPARPAGENVPTVTATETPNDPNVAATSTTNPGEQNSFTKKAVKANTLATIVALSPADSRNSCFLNPGQEVMLTKEPEARAGVAGQFKVTFQGAPPDCTLSEGYVVKAEWDGF